MFRAIRRLTWPATFGRRFGLALVVYSVTLFAASLLIGFVKGLSLAETMFEVWLWAFLIGLVISLGQAWLGTPGESFWRPAMLARKRHDQKAP